MGRHNSSSEEDERDRRRRQRHSDSHRDKRKETEEQSEVAMPNVPKLNLSDNVEDKSSVEYQRLTWDALHKSINGLVNKVNARNIKNIIPKLFAENLIRGRGLFCCSCINSQMASPESTDVFAALIAVVNSKFPQVGLLLLTRVVLLLLIAYTLNDKPRVLAAAKFIAHLVNQQVAEEIIALEFVTLFLEEPTSDTVEVAVVFVKECGARLQDVTPKGLNGIFERFRSILYEGEIDKRVQYLTEGLYFAKFPRHPAVRPELDLAEEKYSHGISLDQGIDPETSLDVFIPDPDFLENEKKYEELKKELLAEEEDDGYDASSEDKDELDEEEMRIRDETETNLVNLRRRIYQTIMSTVDFEEAGHKLLKIKLELGQEMELCKMLLERCSQERTYLRHYGLLGQRLCMTNKIYKDNFEKCFVQKHLMIDRLETNKLRNVAKFFSHLLATEALPWQVFSYIKEDTTSSSRIFIKFLFEELTDNLGITLLAKRLQDLTMQESLESNMRFSINFFTSIGLGSNTENLGEYLKNMQQRMQVVESESGSSSGSDSSCSCSDSESDSSCSDSESDSCSSDSESDSCSSDSESDSSSSSSDESDREKTKRRRRN